MFISNVSAEPLVYLGGGLIVPVAPYRLLLALERRGITCDVEGKDLLVGPSTQLTDADRAAIRQWKRDLVTLVLYVPPPCKESVS